MPPPANTHIPASAAPCYRLLADDVFLKDGDVSVSGLHVEVPEECRANVDGQAVIDEVR